MGWLGWIALILIAFFFIVYCSFKVYEGADGSWGVLILWLPASLFFTLMVFIIFLLISGCDPFGKYKRVESGSTYTEIYSIGLHNNVSGQFSLGCGSVESKPVYYYYRKKNGGYVLDRVNAEQCTIVETNSKKPSLKHVKYKKVGEAGWYKRAVFGNNEDFWRPCDDNERTVEYIIYIPVGSIMQNYNINL